jgi:hypothetical protein
MLPSRGFRYRSEALLLLFAHTIGLGLCGGPDALPRADNVGDARADKDPDRMRRILGFINLN